MKQLVGWWAAYPFGRHHALLLVLLHHHQPLQYSLSLNYSTFLLSFHLSLFTLYFFVAVSVFWSKVGQLLFKEPLCTESANDRSIERSDLEKLATLWCWPGRGQALCRWTGLLIFMQDISPEAYALLPPEAYPACATHISHKIFLGIRSATHMRGERSGWNRYFPNM